MNARTHQVYLTPDLWRALQHVAAVRNVTVEEVLEDIAWEGLRKYYPNVIDAATIRREWLKRHDAEVRDTIKKAIESKVKAKRKHDD